MQLCRPSMNKFAWFERWRLLLENAPLECDGMTRCISTLLHHHQIEHSVHIGALTVEGGGRIPLHWWIVLEGGEHIDLRAQMWLGTHPHVPHGIFLPTHVATYQMRVKPRSSQRAACGLEAAPPDLGGDG